LVLVETEIFFHARHECIADVGLVEVLDEVAQSGVCEYCAIQLEEESALFWRLVYALVNQFMTSCFDANTYEMIEEFARLSSILLADSRRMLNLAVSSFV
jgi:hypothetical protein